jgi:crotonobetaine/carnitine-CoA ligase
MDSADALYCMVPVYHSAARMMLWAVTRVGGRCIFRRSFSRSDFWRDVRQFRCTLCFLPAATIPWLLSEPERADDARNPLRFVFTVPITEQAGQFGQRFQVQMKTGYGSTETGTIVLGRYNPLKPSSCGKLRTGYPGFNIRIIDEQGCDVPVGDPGELLVRAADPSGMFKEYFRDVEATRLAWRKGWFHTGDRLRMDEDGELHFVDRVKDAIRRRGENISSLEVEALVNEIPEVAEAAAIAVVDDGGEDELKIVVVARPSSNLTPGSLHEQLRATLPRFMVPRYVEIVDALPKTAATARILKVELRKAGITSTTWDSEKASVDVS